MPTKVDIQEEGPCEGFQIEPGPISTERKIELIDALSETGLQKIQVASFVNPKGSGMGRCGRRSVALKRKKASCITPCG